MLQPAFALVFFLLLLSCLIHGQVPVENVRSFGTAIKGITLAVGPVETLLFNFATDSPSCVTSLWFTGELFWPTFAETRIRIYVDQGEDATSTDLDMELFLAHGIGFNDMNAPWGTETIGKLGVGGGVYDTFRIPFSKSIRITASLSPNETESRIMYFMVRGLENYPVILKGSFLQLPSNAQFHLAKTNVVLNPLDWVSLVSVNNASGGVLFMVVQQLESQNAHCLEGIHMAEIDNTTVLQLSSGFEDYYLSAQYFDAGPFRTPLSGLTHEDRQLDPNRLSAYRIHEFDPIVFQESLNVTWRNGMHDTGSLAAGITHHISYTFYYTW